MKKEESIIKQLYEFAKKNSESSPLELKEIQEEFRLDMTKRMLDYEPDNWLGQSLIIHILNQTLSNRKYPQIKTNAYGFNNVKLIGIHELIKDGKMTNKLEMSINWSDSNTTSYVCELPDNIRNDSEIILRFKWHSCILMKRYSQNNMLEEYINLERLNTKLLKLYFNVDLDNLDLRNPYDNDIKQPNNMKPIEIRLT